jgi:hypothetical protein
LVPQHLQTAIFTSLLQSLYFQCIGLVAPNHILYSCCIHISPWSAGMRNLIILFVMNISEFCAPLSDMLHCHNAIILHLYHLAVNFDGGICFTLTNQILLWTSAQDSFQCHFQCTSTSLLNRISLLCHLYVTLLKCYCLFNNKILITKVTDWGTILIEHAWCFWLFVWNCYKGFSISFSFLACVTLFQESTLSNSKYFRYR